MPIDSPPTIRIDLPQISSSDHTLVVRPIMASEREAWDTLMDRHHYLGFRVIVGESLRYVAFLGKRPVALIGWGAAAFKSRHRDAWIGWEAHLKWRRLCFIANNVRFLILPDVHIQNLASRILGQNLRRLSADWEAAYGHPILIAETFVDTSRFRGTCYKAAGFLPLGETRGFRRNGGKYYLHGQPKTILVRPLRPDARRLLADQFSNLTLFKEEGIMVDIRNLNIDGKGGLIEYLRLVPDHRKKRGIRHRTISILAVSVCAVLSGAKNYIAIAEWADRSSQSMLTKLWCPKSNKTGKRVPPSEPTIRRFLGEADVEAVDKTVDAWLERQAMYEKDRVIAIDGKTLKASARKGERQVHLLSALLHHPQVVLAQVQVDAKSNEIPAVKLLLEPLDIQGAVVTADAMHTQNNTATFIVHEKKQTTSSRSRTIRKRSTTTSRPSIWRVFPPQHETVDKGHGRIETRRIWTSTELKGYIEFPYHEQVVRIERSVADLAGNPLRHEVVSGITSLTPDKAGPERLLQINREHWGIENKLHYVRDVTYDEDRCRIRTKSGPRIMASLRNIAIGILRLRKHTNIAQAVRHYAAKQHLTLGLIGI